MTLSEYWQADSRPTFHEWRRSLRLRGCFGSATRPQIISPIHSLKIEPKE